jgi:hypothetical protein
MHPSIRLSVQETVIHKRKETIGIHIGTIDIQKVPETKKHQSTIIYDQPVPATRRIEPLANMQDPPTSFDLQRQKPSSITQHQAVVFYQLVHQTSASFFFTTWEFRKQST